MNKKRSFSKIALTGFAMLFSLAAYANKTNLNVAVIYTQDFKDEVEKSSTVENYIDGMISTANQIYTDSLVQVNLNTALIAPVVLSLDSKVYNQTPASIMNAYKHSYFELVDYDHQDALVNYVSDHGKIHQVILLLKPASSTTNCGVAAAPEGGIGIFSVVVPQCKDNLTLPHEVAHNLGAIHAKGIYDEENHWRSLMNTGGTPTVFNPRRYITNPALTASDCGLREWRWACGQSPDYNNAEDMNNNRVAAHGNYCELNIDTQEVNCPEVPKPGNISSASYESGNCSGRTRLGEVTWGTSEHATNYQVQYKSGVSWYTFNEGLDFSAPYNTSATGKTHYFRVRGKNIEQSGNWKYFNRFIPRCTSGGGGGFAN